MGIRGILFWPLYRLADWVNDKPVSAIGALVALAAAVVIVASVVLGVGAAGAPDVVTAALFIDAAGGRPAAPVGALVGGDDALNRFAVEEPRVDVLARPMDGGGDFNHVLAKAARDNDVHVEFDLGPLLRATGGKRVRALADLRKLREIVTYYDAPHVVSANARSHLGLRAPRELVAAAEAVGFDPEWVCEGLRAWGEIAARNRDRRSEAFIEPGVRRGRYEEDG